MEYAALKQLGLRENEIKVYISLLELGVSKVDAISKRVPLPRTTIYGILKSLLEKGLVSYVIKSGIKYFEATDPKRLLLIEKEKIQVLQNLIPSLEKIKETVTIKPSIEIYEGIEGIKSIYEDMLKTKQTIYGYGNTYLLFELIQYYIPNYLIRRIKEKIKFYVITERSTLSIKLQKKDKKEFRETRFLDQLKEMTITTYLYGEKTAIIVLLKKEPLGIIIENKSITNSQKIIFDLLWGIAKKT
ncbi:MAG: hypothetical protein N3G19_01735 [Candidatus Pacearchaeota archaeon]|nr:hypothetical protein [Candidatus Pacearchaeota archaeon]